MTGDRDQEFLSRAEALLSNILSRLDEFDPDELEADSAAGVIKMAFADRSVCVLNRQTAAHQIWLAEGATAWHFERPEEGDSDKLGGEWLDTKGRGSLNTVMSDILSRRLGRAITI